jgi:hypothetical protein
VSYDVFLQRFDKGKAMSVESSAVWGLLEQAWDAPPDKHGYCRVRRGTDEGDLYADQPGEAIDGLMFNHAGPQIYHLMYEVATEGDMAIIPPDTGPFIVREEQREHLPSDLKEQAVVIQSGEELLRAIQQA